MLIRAMLLRTRVRVCLQNSTEIETSAGEKGETSNIFRPYKCEFMGLLFE